MRSARLRRGIALVAFASTSALLAPGPQVQAATVARQPVSYACPVEDRTTRPNNGGPEIDSFAVHGVDRSHWDATISFADLRAAGQTFAYFKATQGTYMIDWTYESQARAARRAGLLVGAYHFFDWRLSGVSQARYFVTAVNARGGFHGWLRPMVDVECYAPLGRPVPPYTVARLRAFVTEVERLVGVRPVVYTSIFEWRTMTGGDATFGDCRLWSAEWGTTSPLKLPPGWTSWTFWQYGPTFHLGADMMDGDVYRRSRSSLSALVVP